MASMKDIRIDKIVVNIGVGKAGEPLDNAVALIERLTGRKAVRTTSRTRNPTWGLRKGLPIGTKVTLRGTDAETFLKKAFEAVGRKIRASSFDGRGNFAFGVKEYIDFPGVKYDPKIGMLGFDVCVSLKRPGYRVANRKISAAAIGKKHIIQDSEAQEFVSKAFGVKVLSGAETE
ncbi:MAG: 50S ribosomal protein L5 [Candidatus Micrarchaeia archaeon]